MSCSFVRGLQTIFLSGFVTSCDFMILNKYLIKIKMLNELLAYVYAVEQNKTLFILISANLTYFIPKEMHRGTRSGLLFYFCLNLQNHSCKKKEKKIISRTENHTQYFLLLYSTS